MQNFVHRRWAACPTAAATISLRTYGRAEEFTDLDAQLAGGGGEVTIDLMQTNLGLSATIYAARLDAQGGLRHPQFRRKVAFTIDGETLTVDCLMLRHLCNGRTYGGGFYAAPEARPDDGWLDVFIIRRVSRLTIARLLGMAQGALCARRTDRAGEAPLPLTAGQSALLRSCGRRGPIVRRRTASGALARPSPPGSGRRWARPVAEARLRAVHGPACQRIKGETAEKIVEHFCWGAFLLS